ncbi:MAG: histidine kinase [Chloroflexota bacterium]|nr:histidine kinase [Chloroflexota bacterium]
MELIGQMRNPALAGRSAVDLHHWLPDYTAPGGLRQLRGRRRYVLLWSCLVVLSLVAILVPGASVAVSNPLLSVALATLDGVVGLAVCQLGLLRFLVFGRRLDLFAGLGFGVLAVADLGIWLLGLLIGHGPTASDVSLLLMQLSRGLAAGLFLIGVSDPERVVAPERRRRMALSTASGFLLVLLLGTVTVLIDNAGVSAWLAPTVPLWPVSVGTLDEYLPGQQPVLLVLLNYAVALMQFAAAVIYLRAASRLADAQLMLLAVALTLLSFSQVHTLLLPVGALEVVTSADALRLTAYLVLLYALARRIAEEIAAQASHEERLHLSRELHDGLAQDLSLLHLRLSRATAPDWPAETRARDVEVAQRLAEAALLEARQAITALRTGTVSWEEFINALTTFSDEFSSNHEVGLALRTEGQVRELAAGLEVEILRIVREIFTNALMHGGATELLLTVVAGAEALELTVRDNGRGFDLEQALAGAGIGLNSMVERLQRYGGKLAIDSSPGAGTTVRVWLPLAGPSRSARQN